MVLLLYFVTMQSVSTVESEAQNSLNALEPRSTDFLGHQHNAKKLSPKITLHFKVLCESKVMLPKITYFATFTFVVSQLTVYYTIRHSIFLIFNLGIHTINYKVHTVHTSMMTVFIKLPIVDRQVPLGPYIYQVIKNVNIDCVSLRSITVWNGDATLLHIITARIFFTKSQAKSI